MKTSSQGREDKLRESQFNDSPSRNSEQAFTPPVYYPHEPIIPTQLHHADVNASHADTVGNEDSMQFRGNSAVQNNPGQQVRRVISGEVVQCLLSGAMQASTGTSVLQLLSNEEAAELKLLGFNDEALAALHKLQINFAQSKHLYKIGFESESFLKLIKTPGLKLTGQMLFGQVLVLNSAPYGLNVEEITENFVMFGNDFKKIKALHSTNTPLQVKEAFAREKHPQVWTKFFKNSEALFRPFITRFTWGSIILMAKRGKTAKDLLPLLEADFDFDQISLVLNQQRFSIPEVAKMIDRFDLGQIDDLKKVPLSITANQLIDLDKSGVPFDTIKNFGGGSSAALATSLKTKFSDLVFSAVEIRQLYDRNFTIQDIIALSVAKKANAAVSLGNIIQLNDQKLSPGQITSAAQTPYFRKDFLQALAATQLQPLELIALRKANFYQMKELVTMKTKFGFTYETIRSAQVAAIPYIRIQQMFLEAKSNGVVLTPRRIIDFGPTKISMASVKFYSDQKKSHQWILAKAKSGFTDTQVESLKKVLTLKNIGELGKHFTPEQIGFLRGKGFSFDNLQQFSTSGISFGILSKYLTAGATPPQVLHLTSSGFQHNEIVGLFKEVKDITTVAALAYTGFSYQAIQDMRTTGFSYPEILSINRDTKLDPTQITTLRKSASNVTVEEIIWHGRTNFSIADLRALKTKGITIQQLGKLSEFGYSVIELSQFMTLLQAKQSGIGLDMVFAQIEALSNTRFTPSEIVSLLDKPLSTIDIVALGKTAFTVTQLLQLITSHNVATIVVRSQDKFTFPQIQQILNVKATGASPADKLEQALELGKTRFLSSEIVKFFNAGFDIDQIISLSKSKLNSNNILKLKSSGASPAIIYDLGRTGYEVKEINQLNVAIAAVNSSIQLADRFKITILFGTRGYNYEQAIIMLGSPFFVKLTMNLKAIEPITKSYSFNDVLFLSDQNSGDSKLDPIALARAQDRDVRDLGKRNPVMFKISSWIPEWRKAVEEIKEEIAELSVLHAYPQLHDLVASAIERMRQDLKDIGVLALDAQSLSQKILKPGFEDANLENFNAKKIAAHVVEMNRIVAAARKSGQSSAAMSALGRAIEREGNPVDPNEAKLSVGTQALYGMLKVGKPGKNPESAPEVFDPTDESPAAPKGVLLNPGQPSTPISKIAEYKGNPHAIRGIIAQLPKPPDPGNKKVVYEGPAKRKDRGAGQASAMGGLNAATYAYALAMIQGAGITDWEWLHIRAAGLGGSTNSKNLLPGLSSANTLMIPFENNLKNLSQMASRQRPLTVDYIAEQPHPQSNNHAYRYIKITWKFGDNSSQDNLQKGEAKFDIVKGRVVTKGDIRLLEEFLKQQRSEIKF